MLRIALLSVALFQMRGVHFLGLGIDQNVSVIVRSLQESHRSSSLFLIFPASAASANGGAMCNQVFTWKKLLTCYAIKSAKSKKQIEN